MKASRKAVSHAGLGLIRRARGLTTFGMPDAPYRVADVILSQGSHRLENLSIAVAIFVAIGVAIVAIFVPIC